MLESFTEEYRRTAGRHKYLLLWGAGDTEPFEHSGKYDCQALDKTDGIFREKW